MLYVGDFETLTTEPTYVWAWCLFDGIDYEIGNNIYEFFDRLDREMEEVEIFFHNLKFDGSFILNYLINNGYKYVDNLKKNDLCTYTCLIAGLGTYYSISFYNKNKVKIVIKNSLNLLPFSVESIAKSLNLDVLKGNIDYEAYRPEYNYILTKEEEEYIKNDVYIVFKALQEVYFNKGLYKMTIGANALDYFKKFKIDDKYRTYFPKLQKTEDEFIRKAYKGGLCFTKTLNTLDYTGDGCTFDYNSMYPSVMLYKPLPVGYPKKISKVGKFKENKLYVLHLKVKFKVKEKGVPFIQLKGNLLFEENEYVKDSLTVVDLHLTNVDYSHFVKNYEVEYLEFCSGYELDSTTGLFDDYINEFAEMKKIAKEKGDDNSYLLSKLMLNSLTGKFATCPKNNIKIPYIDREKEILKFTIGEAEKETEYIPTTTFITSWARHELLNAIYQNYDNFLYCDTDSLHLSCKPEDVKLDNIHNSNFGCWSLEDEFVKARYVKQKTYIEQKKDGKLVVKCAGLNKKYHHKLNFDNFKKGCKVKGVLKPFQVKGGVILKELDYIIT